MYSMNKVVWDKPIDKHAYAAPCCIKVSIGVERPVHKSA